MFTNTHYNHCDISNKFLRKYDDESTNFIKIVSAEDRLAKAIRVKEIQITAENPQIRQQEQITKISTALSEQLRKQFVDQKKRQQYRENDLNLRILQKQIEAARVAKELNQQRVVRQQMLEMEKCQKQKEIEERKKNQALVADAIKQQEAQTVHKKELFRNALKMQMDEKKRRIEHEKAEIMEDQKKMRELQESINAKKLNDWNQMQTKKQHQQKEIKQYLVFQEEIRKQEKEAIQKEQNRLLQIQKEREEHEKRAKEAKNKETNKTQALSEKIGQQLLELQTEKKDRENQLLDLLVEELKAIEDKRHQQNINLKMQERIQLQTEYEINQDALLYKKNHEKEKNERAHKQLSENVINATHQDELAKNRRKEKAQAYAKEIHDIIAANRAQQLADKLLEQQINENHVQDERKRLEEVKKEYIRLSENEPADVLQFLPLRHRRNCCI